LGRYTNKENLYWGDIHAHTKYSDGMGTPDEALTYARDFAKLDFAAITDHDDIGPYLSNEEWMDTKKVISKFNVPNKFVTFLGHEYRSDLADMNIYYPNNDGILMCGKKKEWNEPSKLIPVIAQKGGMIIPHMHFGADWSGYIPTIYRVMEIYSQHGSAEYIGCPMGSELNANKRKLDIYCIGTYSIFQIEVIKNNRTIHRTESNSPECSFSIDDIAERDEDFYYIRIIQQDTEMAWSSPIWVRKE